MDIHTQDAPKLRIIMGVARIQVITESAFEHGRILRNDSKAATEVEQANGGNVESVDAVDRVSYDIQD